MKLMNCSECELNVLFTDNAGIQEFNLKYLGKNKPTNVLSFSLNEGGYSEENSLGDIVISVETALRDAEKGNLSLEHEIDFLMIHGVLHLLGYDHIASRSEARKMSLKQKELFKILNGFSID
jgi:probable rRNA maturation factor